MCILETFIDENFEKLHIGNIICSFFYKMCILEKYIGGKRFENVNIGNIYELARFARSQV